MANHTKAGLLGDFGGAIRGGIVDDNNFRALTPRRQPLQDVGDACLFVERGNDDRDGFRFHVSGLTLNFEPLTLNFS